MQAGTADITAVIRSGKLDETTARALIAELRKTARALRAKETALMQETTELVHEVYLRLFATHPPKIVDRKHFFALAARILRRLLIDLARRRRQIKHASPMIQSNVSPVGGNLIDSLAFDQALTRLDQVAPRAAQMVELRHLLGLNTVEIAELLEVGEATVRRDLSRAKHFLGATLVL